MPFRNREEAGRLLARAVAGYRGKDVVVLGLPRGGVPVAAEVAQALEAPLDVLVVRKLGVPGMPELALGAVGEGGIRVLNDEVIARCGITPDVLASVEAAARREVEDRAVRLRSGAHRLRLAGRVALVVDDGAATGATARAACQVARAEGAAKVVLALPVASPEASRRLQRVADVVCLEVPQGFLAVGEAYGDFRQVSDDQVVTLLDRTRRRAEPASPGPAGSRIEEDVEVPAGEVTLAGHLVVPAGAAGLVVFAHGSGSSRKSPRNRQVAALLNDAGLGTLLVDLLAPDEQADRAMVFDVQLLADRLLALTGWARSHPGCEQLATGYFGASTGAAAALWAAADLRSQVRAVVSRGGRPDLAARRLAKVSVPTLLIVGSHDEMVLRLNRQALRFLGGLSELAVVRGATHLFEEPGTMDRVAILARDWFTRFLSPAVAPPRPAGQPPAS
ncbi:MAG TPA: phosphoribosyltransferase family protein [Marmoricola sp.]|nr:phosphoribosyltransferase family protein [Marmoricola sp.]